ncbi:cytochrome P450 [Phlebopus sp. FC_14]|nr:cytochrome P450 [Phlebopus sp. FC_14]
MSPTIVQGALGGALLSVLLVIWRRFLAPNPLDNIPGPPRKSLLKGNLGDVFNPNAWSFYQMLADRYGSVVKIHGIFGNRELFVSDPKALHNIIIKDQAIFEEAEAFIATNKIVFGNGLLSTLGDHHRKQRKMLNPVFSINHMRYMVPIFQEISAELRDAIVAQVKDGPQEINMLEWFTRTALELVGQSGLGYSFATLKSGVVHPFAKAVKNLLPSLFRITVARRFLPYVVNIGPPGFRKFIVKITPWQALQGLNHIVDVMHETSTEVYEAKKKAFAAGDEAVQAQVGQGKDIMSILLQANMNASEEDRLPDEELLGQMSTLVFAAMDTTSGALSRLLLTLAHHPDVQEKLREEIKQARAEKGQLNYDDLVNLPYLDAVCRETLRLYPPVTQVGRNARKDAVLPFSTPLKGEDGSELHEVLVPKGTNVIVSILNCNRSREIWGEDAMEWKPERWLSPLPSTVTNAQIPGVYSHLMTFIGGGRACIGFKFSQLEMKTVLCALLESLRFRPAKEIVWTVGLSSPRVKDSKDAKFQLPVVVELVKDGEAY